MNPIIKWLISDKSTIWLIRLIRFQWLIISFDLFCLGYFFDINHKLSMITFTGATLIAFAGLRLLMTRHESELKERIFNDIIKQIEQALDEIDTKKRSTGQKGKRKK